MPEGWISKTALKLSLGVGGKMSWRMDDELGQRASSATAGAAKAPIGLWATACMQDPSAS